MMKEALYSSYWRKWFCKNANQSWYKKHCFDVKQKPFVFGTCIPKSN